MSTRTAIIPIWLPAALVLAAIPFVRPNILGEHLSALGFAVLCAAAAAALLQRRGSLEGRLASVVPGRVDPAAALIICLGLGYVWLLLRDATTDPGSKPLASVQGIVLTVGSLLAIMIVCQEPRARVIVARGFVILVVLLCGFYIVTVFMWVATGVGSGQIGTFEVGAWGQLPLYFPFTTTAGPQSVFGITVQRFVGVGREPGWMSMYCAIAFFLVDTLRMRRQKMLKVALIVGLLGCVSTAGFGVFVVTWAYHRFLRDRGGISLANYLRQVGGLGAMALATWLAVAAPVVGFAAKSTQNPESLGDRSTGTEAGIDALFNAPWGGNYTILGGGVNLISDIAVSGLPFVALVCIGLLLTMVRTGGLRTGNAIAVVVLLTMLTSQPAKDSTWAFGLVVLACTLRRPDTEIPDPLLPDPGLASARRGEPAARDVVEKHRPILVGAPATAVAAPA